jgi:uncharacterized protein
MTRVMIIHGIEGNPLENWFPWLKTELEKKGYTVDAPDFPNPSTPQLHEWLEEYQKYEKPDIVIGNSLGSAFLLSVLEKDTVEVAILVASVSGPLDNEFDSRMTSFSHKEFNWSAIKEHCNTFYVFHTDNDPYVPLEASEKLARNLGVELTVVKGAGHFNTSAGYTQIPEVLELLDKPHNNNSH